MAFQSKTCRVCEGDYLRLQWSWKVSVSNGIIAVTMSWHNIRLTLVCDDATRGKPTGSHTCVAHTITCSISWLVTVTNDCATASFTIIYFKNHHSSVFFYMGRQLAAKECAGYGPLKPHTSHTHCVSSSPHLLLCLWTPPLFRLPWHQEQEAVSQPPKHRVASATQVCVSVLYNVHTTNSPDRMCSCSYMTQEQVIRLSRV